MEDRTKRTATVRPQLGEHCESQSNCDSALDVKSDGKSDGNDIELHGETEFDDGSAQVRSIRNPGQPTANEHQQHMTTHRPYKSWCKFSVVGRGVNTPHKRRMLKTIWKVCSMSMDHGFLGEGESEEPVTCAGHP